MPKYFAFRLFVPPNLLFSSIIILWFEEKQGQTVHMLQLFWIYIPLARLCIMYMYIYINTYIHIYKYIYIYIYMFYSSIFRQHFHSGCYAWKSLIIWTFQNIFWDQNLNFLISFQNSFRNELHAPFYPIFIPNTSYIKKKSLCS